MSENLVTDLLGVFIVILNGEPEVIGAQRTQVFRNSDNSKMDHCYAQLAPQVQRSSRSGQLVYQWQIHLKVVTLHRHLGLGDLHRELVPPLQVSDNGIWMCPSATPIDYGFGVLARSL